MSVRTNRTWVMDRRGFLRVVAASAAMAAAGSLTGCDAKEAYDRAVTGKRTITDDAGRELEIPAPDKLEKIYFTSGLAQVWVFTLNPDKQGGSCSDFTADQLQYLPDGIDELPRMGAISENAQIDKEMLMAQGIQLVFSISGIGLTETNVSDAETLQEQTGIPVVLVDGSFDRIATAYRFVGDIMGEEERAEELATFCENKYNEVVAAVANVPESKRTRIYYAEGPQGVQTDSDESQHALTFKLAGAENVAKDIEVIRFGRTSVNLEKVIEWNPEVIFAVDEDNGGCDQTIRSDKDWSGIQAVKDDAVYTIPYCPFSWVDSPPGVNRLIGIMWVANLLYPDYYSVDMIEVTKEFYKTMYWVDINDDQARDLLGSSYTG